MNKKPQYTEIVVTVERRYLLQMADAERTEINGWTPDEVVADWFQRYDINSHHATRDTHRISGADRVVAIGIRQPSPNRIAR